MISLIAVVVMGLTFTDHVSPVTALVVLGVCVTAYVTVRSGGPWRDLAEGYKQERNEAMEREKDLIRQVVELESIPDYHEIAEATGAIVIVLQNMQETQALISAAVDKHSEAATKRYERLAILLEGRDPRIRTRATDPKEQK